MYNQIIENYKRNRNKISGEICIGTVDGITEEKVKKIHFSTNFQRIEFRWNYRRKFSKKKNKDAEGITKKMAKPISKGPQKFLTKMTKEFRKYRNINLKKFQKELTVKIII